jgi:hypothetical protein
MKRFALKRGLLIYQKVQLQTASFNNEPIWYAFSSFQLGHQLQTGASEASPTN